MHVIKAVAIETSKHVHYVIESYSSVKSTWMWLMVTLCLNNTPSMSIIIIAECIIKPLLLNINTTKYDHFVFYWDSRMSISWLRSYSLNSFYFIPCIWGETVMIEIIHCVFSIPAPKYYHLMINDYCTVTQSIKRLRFTLRFDKFPFEVFENRTFIKFSKSLYSVLTSKNI